MTDETEAPAGQQEPPQRELFPSLPRPQMSELVTDEAAIRGRAEQGYPDAQYDLANLYWREELEPEIGWFDRLKVVRHWFEMAAEQGHCDAQFHLAYLMMEDGGENEVARKWCLSAADQGHPEACMLLCEYDLEYGCDEADAIRWYRRGRELGHPHDAGRLGIHGPYFDDWKVLHPEKEEQRLKKVPSRFFRQAQHLLGTLHATGRYGTKQSMIEAYAWFAIAANHKPGSPVEPTPVGQSSHVGWGTPERAVRLIELVLDDEELESAYSATLDLRFRRRLWKWLRSITLRKE